MEKSQLEQKKSWRKILYEKQDYPDNYVDKAQFLNGLKKNCKHAQTQTLRCNMCKIDDCILYDSVHGDLWPGRSDPRVGSGNSGTQQVLPTSILPGMSTNSVSSYQCVCVCGDVLVRAGELALSPLPPLPLSTTDCPVCYSSTSWLERQTTPITMDT